MLQYFVNHGDLLDSLDVVFSQKRIARIGTGEYTDSLIWEKIYPFSETLVLKFATQQHAALELKTKTVSVENLLHLEHNRKTILAWSLNTQKVIQQSEKGTSSLSARLKTASECEIKGYPLAFHFDPLIIYPGCDKDYQEAIEQLFHHVSPDNIVWISLGTFRFIPDLKLIIEKRFTQSKIAHGEFIKGMDGKMRYFKPLRIDLYKKIINAIRAFAPNVLIYFCMEDDEVWQKSLGITPSEFGGLSNMLDSAASKSCHLVEY